MAAEIDLRSRLFAFGGGIGIENPEALRQKLLQRSREALEANGDQALPPAAPPSEEPARRFFPSRLRRD